MIEQNAKDLIYLLRCAVSSMVPDKDRVSSMDLAAIYQLAQYQGNELIFNVSSGRGISQNQVLDIIRQETGLKVDVEHKDHRSVDARKMILDNHKVVAVCGNHVTLFEDGVKRYYEYLKRQMQDA